MFPTGGQPDLQLVSQVGKDLSQAKIADYNKKSYDTFAQMQESIDNTSGRINELIGSILGVKSLRGKRGMANLSRAMHLTNMIRKLGKDYERKNRCNIPRKDMKKYKID